MRQDWWAFIKIGFLRAERYYQTKLAAGDLPDGFRLQDLDLDSYGHEFLTAFVEITSSAESVIRSVANPQPNNYLRDIVAITWRDFVSFFVDNDTFAIGKLEERGLVCPYDVAEYCNPYREHLVSLFSKLALYRWRYPFRNQGARLIDINERLDQFIERLKLGRIEDISTDPSSLTGLTVLDNLDLKLHQISALAFEQGKAAGKREGSKQAAELARKQLIANSDKQAEELFPVLRELTNTDNAATLQEVADKLNDRKILTKNGNIWNPTNVKILIERVNKLFSEDPIVLKKDAHSERLRPIVQQIRKNGAKTLADIAQALNEEKIPSKHGKIWHASSVRVLLERIDKVEGLSVG